MTTEVLYPGMIVYVLNGRTYHHAVIQSQTYNDKQNKPVVCIKWVTVPHYGNIEILCDRLMELPTKRNRFPPFRSSPENFNVTTTHRVNRQSLRQKQTSYTLNRTWKRVTDWDKTGCRRIHERKRKRCPDHVGRKEYPKNRKRSRKYKSMRFRDCYSQSKCNEIIQNRCNVIGNSFDNVEHGENIPHCSVMFCEKKQLERLSCRKSCRSNICIPCMKQMLSHSASEKMRCPTCRQQFSPRTFEHIIASYK
jgi:hypothetical protein